MGNLPVSDAIGINQERLKDRFHLRDAATYENSRQKMRILFFKLYFRKAKCDSRGFPRNFKPICPLPTLC